MFAGYSSSSSSKIAASLTTQECHPTIDLKVFKDNPERMYKECLCCAALHFTNDPAISIHVVKWTGAFREFGEFLPIPFLAHHGACSALECSWIQFCSTSDELEWSSTSLAQQINLSSVAHQMNREAHQTSRIEHQQHIIWTWVEKHINSTLYELE